MKDIVYVSVISNSIKAMEIRNTQVVQQMDEIYGTVFGQNRTTAGTLRYGKYSLVWYMFHMPAFNTTRAIHF
jgi:hypothetical protein